MKELTREWVKKAEGDYFVLGLLWKIQQGASLHFDAICFHAQQCAEKYIKARLHEAEMRFSKTHDFRILLKLVSELEPEWLSHKDELDLLSNFAVAFRYPEEDATEADAAHAFEFITRFRGIARQSLGLPNEE